MSKFKDFENEVKDELAAEKKGVVLDLLKERLFELEAARAIVAKLEREYQKLLEQDVDDVDLFLE